MKQPMKQPVSRNCPPGGRAFFAPLAARGPQGAQKLGRPGRPRARAGLSRLNVITVRASSETLPQPARRLGVMPKHHVAGRRLAVGLLLLGRLLLGSLLGNLLGSLLLLLRHGNGSLPRAPETHQRPIPWVLLVGTDDVLQRFTKRKCAVMKELWAMPIKTVKRASKKFFGQKPDRSPNLIVVQSSAGAFAHWLESPQVALMSHLGAIFAVV